MRSCPKCSSPSAPPPSVPPIPPTRPGVFSPEFLAHLREQDGVITVTEAEFAGPWKAEPVPGRPGKVAVVREWESLETGDAHRGIFTREELALLWTAALPLSGREALLYLEEEVVQPEPGGKGEAGYPVVAVEGEQGPVVCGWLPLFEPGVVGSARCTCSRR